MPRPRTGNSRARIPETEDGLLTLPQVVQILSLRPREVVEYVRRGELAGQHVGRRWTFTQAAIDAFLEELPDWQLTSLCHGE